MSPDRNAPCPCGSGKKYKKCHGMAAPVVSLNKADSFSLNRLVAYKGNIGKRREQFCLDYADSKRKMITEVENELSREVAASGNKITCSKGCGECCTAFIAASLQECEAIVYYLYHHEETLRHFLDEYKVWKAGIDKIENLFRRVCAMQESIMSAPYTESQISSFAEESERFMEQRIHCPFLMDGACSIYPVRPYVCAGVVSTLPAGMVQLYPSLPRKNRHHQGRDESGLRHALFHKTGQKHHLSVHAGVRA